MLPHVVVDFPEWFLPEELKGNPGFSFQWPVANRYEVFEADEQKLISPHPDCEFPEDFSFYDPGQEEIHKKLINIEKPADPEEMLAFVEEWGLLGTWLRGANFEGTSSEPTGSYFAVTNPRLKLDPISEGQKIVDETKENRPIHTSKSQQTVSASDYFEPFLRPETKDMDALQKSSPDNKLALSNELLKTFKMGNYSYLGESLNETAPRHGSIPRQLSEFKKMTKTLTSEEPNIISKEYLPSIHLRTGLQKYFDTENKAHIFYSVDSLLDVGFFQAHLDQHDLNICPECNSLFLPKSKKGKKRKFCSDSCRDNFNNRRNNQREKWEDFLKNRNPDLHEKWEEQHQTTPPNPRARSRFKHPEEIISALKGQEKKLAIEWAKERVQRSTRTEPDPLLQPLLQLEE